MAMDTPMAESVPSASGAAAFRASAPAGRQPMLSEALAGLARAYPADPPSAALRAAARGGVDVTA